MFEVKDSKQIGAYIKKLIYSKYPSQRQFCIEYIKKMGFDEADSEQIRRTTNKVNQIIKGDRATVQVDVNCCKCPVNRSLAVEIVIDR